jgi:hypothetical protein
LSLTDLQHRLILLTTTPAGNPLASRGLTGFHPLAVRGNCGFVFLKRPDAAPRNGDENQGQKTCRPVVLTIRRAACTLRPRRPLMALITPAKTTTRVPEHTPAEINDRIRRGTDETIGFYAGADRTAIDRRLAELDEEWDIERVLEANAASVSLIGLLLTATVSRKFLALPVAVAGFLLQHAIQGWCPPVTFFRRRGARTAREIEDERIALKALRGDFDHLPRGSDVAAVISAARR